MSEWIVMHEKFHTKHSVLTAPNEHMPYIIQLHSMSIRWAYYEQRKQQNIWSVHMISIGIDNRSSQWGKGGGGRLGGVVWVYKIDLKWPVIAMAITRKPQSLSVREIGRFWKLLRIFGKSLPISRNRQSFANYAESAKPLPIYIYI